ncbi:MAG TPA: NADH-quinone oxidoreductase subunit L [Opitutaceae bacterium]|nr:NADH-quinone oxidoreductase subunit L [Opitutaceae bacterium]
MTMLQHAIGLLILPLVSAAIIALFLRRRGGIASIVSVAAAAGIAGITTVLLIHGERFERSMEWLSVGGFTVSMGIKFDDLAALMLTVVAYVGFLIHVFSLGYMKDDGAKARFFGGLSIFMFSMLGIVLADNLFMIFVFWELVGFSSWLLINHYLEKPSAAAASKKAFIVNRVGDFGFLIGIVWCYWQFGTTNLSELHQIAIVQSHLGSMIPAGMALLLFCGAVGKSAQMPLHVWLPDAMEGPTPVSALIHAATMVAAGIYMLCRFTSATLFPAEALNVITWVGVVTALYAALCAVVQNDIKRVLAYSTLSQLGYMVAAFGLGGLAFGHVGSTVVLAAGAGAAMFHLTTHAFFKALLFLGSGSIIHACHHEQDIFKMGGLARMMPVTFVTFTIGVLAIIGMPGLAGFFSKDAILYLAYEKNTAVFVILALGAVLTAFYMTRLWRITFFGASRSDSASHAHETPVVMTLPLVVLAIGAVAGGYLALYPDVYNGILELVPVAHGSAHTVVLVTSLIVLIVGAGAALLFYKPAATDALATRAPALHRLLASKLWFDEFYGYYVAKVQQRLAMVLNFIDQIVLSGLIVRGLAGVVAAFGIGARALHTGNIHSYVYWFLIGAALFWAFAAGVF